MNLRRSSWSPMGRRVLRQTEYPIGAPPACERISPNAAATPSVAADAAAGVAGHPTDQRRGARAASRTRSPCSCQSGTLTSLPRARSRSPASDHIVGVAATSSSGVLDMLMPARSWNSVRVYPGHSAITRTPNGRASCPMDVAEVGDPRLARGVGRTGHGGTEARHRRDIDHCPVATLLHDGQRGVGQPHHGVHVEPQQPALVLDRGPQERPVQRHAGVVDQQVHAVGQQPPRPPRIPRRWTDPPPTGSPFPAARRRWRPGARRRARPGRGRSRRRTGGGRTRHRCRTWPR